MNSHIIASIIILTTLTGCGGGGSTDILNSGSSQKSDLLISTFTGPANAATGDTIDLNVTITNQGDAVAADLAGVVPVAFYLSEDNIIDPLTDLFIGWVDPTAYNGLSASQSAQTIKQVILPSSLGTGTYYLGAYVDPRGVAIEYIDVNFPSLPLLYIDESNETNNAALATSQITITGSSVCVDDAYEDDDTVGHSINLSTLENHNFCYDQIDRLKFDAVAGNTYTMTVNGLNNTHLTLTDANQALIDTDYELSNTASITWTASSSQTYHIEISHSSLRKGNLIRNPMGLGSDYTFIVQ